MVGGRLYISNKQGYREEIWWICCGMKKLRKNLRLSVINPRSQVPTAGGCALPEHLLYCSSYARPSVVILHRKLSDGMQEEKRRAAHQPTWKSLTE